MLYGKKNRTESVFLRCGEFLITLTVVFILVGQNIGQL